MPGPRFHAESITDKEGKHYMACPACLGNGCMACGNAGRLLVVPLEPAPSYQLGTFLPGGQAPPALPALAPEIQALFEAPSEPDALDFPTRPADSDLMPGFEISGLSA
jgi:hypothetical protein